MLILGDYLKEKIKFTLAFLNKLNRKKILLVDTK